MNAIHQLHQLTERLRERGTPLEEEHAGQKMVFGRWVDVKNGGKAPATDAERSQAAEHHTGEAASHRKAAKGSLRRAEESGSDHSEAEKHASTALDHLAHASAHDTEAAHHRTGAEPAKALEHHRAAAIEGYKKLSRQGFKAPYPHKHDAATGKTHWTHP